MSKEVLDSIPGIQQFLDKQYENSTPQQKGNINVNCDSRDDTLYDKTCAIATLLVCDGTQLKIYIYFCASLISFMTKFFSHSRHLCFRFKLNVLTSC